MNFLFKLYSSAKAKGVMADGMASSTIEIEKFDGVNPKSFKMK